MPTIYQQKLSVGVGTLELLTTTVLASIAVSSLEKQFVIIS